MEKQEKVKDKIVVFDWGGVLEGEGENRMYSPNFFLEIAREMGVLTCITNDKASPSLKKMKSIVEEISNTLHVDALVKNDDKTTDKYIYWALDKLHLPCTYEYVAFFKKAFVKCSISIPANKVLVDYVHYLSEKCSIGLLSNCASLEKIAQDVHVQRSVFDKVWLSCDVGCMKPEKDIYQLVAKEMKGYDIFFVDDKKENLEIPQSLGWNTFLYEGSNGRLINAIEQFLSD